MFQFSFNLLASHWMTGFFYVHVHDVHVHVLYCDFDFHQSVSVFGLTRNRDLSYSIDHCAYQAETKEIII